MKPIAEDCIVAGITGNGIVSGNLAETHPASHADRSATEEATNALSEQQQVCLTEALDGYLQCIEQGVPFDARDYCEDDPAILAALSAYLEKLDLIYGIGGAASASSKAIPTVLGEFTLLGEIGRGGMGIVYAATQSSINRRVALKLLPLAGALDERQINRFKNEARAAGALQHPNIVPIYSVGEVDGIHFYAMQLIDGESVEQGIRVQNDPSESAGPPAWNSQQWRPIVRWGIDVAIALQAAHETGVVHRDIKPSNLLIDRDLKIWITDFGLARFQSDASLTHSGDVIGTMRYMSPEQASGKTAWVDGRSDIHSLAATLYEMLSLRHAYSGDDGPSILQAISADSVVPLRQHCPGLPRDLETVIAKAMSKSRDDRYQTAEAFARDLGRVLLGEPTIARPPTLIDRAVRFATRHKRGVFWSTLVCALALIGFAVSMAMIAAEKRTSDLHATRAQHSERLARNAVDRLGSRMAELLSGIPSAEPVRRQLLRETLTYYQTFAENARNDPDLQRDLAMTYGKIGTLQDELNSGHHAIEFLQRSERLYQRIANEDPGNSELRLEWSIAQNNLAQSLHRAGDLEQAARYFAKAIATQEALSGEANDVGATVALSTTLNNLGLLLVDSGATAEAETAYRRSIDLLRSSDQEVRGEWVASQREHQLATVLSNLGAMLSGSRPAAAIETAEEALAIQTKELTADRSNASLARQVVVTLQTLGSAQSNQGNHQSAIENFEKAVDIGGQLLVRWPEQPQYRRDYVVSQNHLGLELSRQGKLSVSRQAFREALTYQRALQDDFPADAETQSMLGGVLNNLGFVLQQLGDPQQAIVVYREAVTCQSSAVGLAPQVARYQTYLAKHRFNLSHLEATQ